MAIIENIINVLVPLLICGLIFIYFRRRITNLEQSVDIIMKMLQTNQLNSGASQDSNNHLVKMEQDDVYVPSDDKQKKRKVEITNLNLEKTNDSDSDSSDHTESEESEESESDDSESDDPDSDSEEKNNVHIEGDKLDESNTTSIEKLVSLITTQDENEETHHQELKKVVLNENDSKEELESKTLNELKKLLKEKNPDINNLSRMNKATVIENLMK